MTSIGLPLTSLMCLQGGEGAETKWFGAGELGKLSSGL